MFFRSSRTLTAMLAAFSLVACGDDDPSGSTEPGEVALRFTAAAGAAAAPMAAGQSLSSRPVTIVGTNGSLVIEEIRVIVAELELDSDDDATNCEQDESDSDSACPDFRAEPVFIDLPLDGGAVTVATEQIPNGTYDELEFEVEDIDLDEEDEEAGAVAAVRAQVLAAFPEWPEEATMVVRGTFTPVGQAARPFTAFFDAEIKVELDLVPPVTISDGVGDASITVQLFPQEWFRNPDGSVVDVSEWDFETTGDAADFEMDIEFESGLEVDLDGFDD